MHTLFNVQESEGCKGLENFRESLGFRYHCAWLRGGPGQNRELLQLLRSVAQLLIGETRDLHFSFVTQGPLSFRISALLPLPPHTPTMSFSRPLARAVQPLLRSVGPSVGPSRALSTSSVAASGHSRWSKIRHKKGAVDAARGSQFSKILTVRGDRRKSCGILAR